MALFLGLSGQASTRKVNPILILLKQETVSGSGISWAICKSVPHFRQITKPAPTTQFFTGRMPFLPPNQQRQSIEGNRVFPPLLENPGIVFVKFPGPRKSWKMSLFLECPRNLSARSWKVLESTLWVKKTRHQTLGHNFTNYYPIFKIFSLADSVVHLQQIHV